MVKGVHQPVGRLSPEDGLPVFRATRLRCRQCGYKYDYGFIPQEYGLAQDTIPGGPVMVPQTRCPSCGYYRRVSRGMVANGDRILVLKDSSIVEEGTHKELMERGGLYRKLYQMQFRDAAAKKEEKEVVRQ